VATNMTTMTTDGSSGSTPSLRLTIMQERKLDETPEMDWGNLKKVDRERVVESSKRNDMTEDDNDDDDGQFGKQHG
jgi:hypothetical protein